MFVKASYQNTKKIWFEDNNVHTKKKKLNYDVSDQPVGDTWRAVAQHFIYLGALAAKRFGFDELTKFDLEKIQSEKWNLIASNILLLFLVCW